MHPTAASWQTVVRSSAGLGPLAGADRDAISRTLTPFRPGSSRSTWPRGARRPPISYARSSTPIQTASTKSTRCAPTTPTLPRAARHHTGYAPRRARWRCTRPPTTCPFRSSARCWRRTLRRCTWRKRCGPLPCRVALRHRALTSHPFARAGSSPPVRGGGVRPHAGAYRGAAQPQSRRGRAAPRHVGEGWLVPSIPLLCPVMPMWRRALDRVRASLCPTPPSPMALLLSCSSVASVYDVARDRARAFLQACRSSAVSRASTALSN